MEPDILHKIRHSLAHLLAAAVIEHFPEVKPTIGPPTDSGFYYDFDFGDKTFSEDYLKEIQKAMRKKLSSWEVFERVEVTPSQARELFASNEYKIELINEIEEAGETMSVYYSGKKLESYDLESVTAAWADMKGFIDLCRGGHVDSPAQEIDAKAFELEKIAGAYWRGSEENTMLTRIYGLAFETPEELSEYKAMMEEARKRDHRKLGQELDLFFIDEMVGKGLVMWLPKGNILKEEVEKLAVKMEKDAGYMRVTSPHIAKEELFLTSGHLPYYKEDMYPGMEMDDGTYYLKAMNCPHHHRMYLHKPKSYRDLPLRLAEYGTVYRNERSGTLAGLLRVRGLAMNDAHIYCRKDQIKDEFKSVLEMTMKYFEIFGLEDYWFRLSKWDPKKTDKYFDEPESWEYSQNVIREVLEEMNVEFTEADDEAAFYGPKVDVQFKSVVGREESMSTIQLDFIAKERFGLTYIDQDGKENNEVFVIHRAPLSTHERFMAFLIEHYGGAFPYWLSPVQVKILPISENHFEYAQAVADKLKEADVRYELDEGDNTLGKKIRSAKMEKVPYIFVIGDKEAESGTITVESRDSSESSSMTLEKFLSMEK